MAIAVAGYRLKGPGHHWLTFEALRLVIPGKQCAVDAQYFNACRRLRNLLSYESADVVGEREVDELLSRVLAFQGRVEDWIKRALTH